MPPSCAIIVYLYKEDIMEGKKLTEDFVFELGKVTIGGDAVKVEEPT